MQSLNPAWIHDFGCGVSILGIHNLDGFFKWRNAKKLKWLYVPQYGNTHTANLNKELVTNGTAASKYIAGDPESE
jgi:hypothetical protein